MRHSNLRQSIRLRNLSCVLVLAIFAGLVNLPVSNAIAARIPILPKWSRFEESFRSRVDYENPLQDCTLTVTFVSPTDETNVIYGFWDGGKTWRVRFRPGQAGHWKFHTSCSDPSNRGLHDKAGEFLCSAPVGTNRFDEHGPIELARDHHHFEHQDGTPFFWLADSVWNGARVSDPNDWNRYAKVRAHQQFSAVQWSVAPGADSEGEIAFSGKSKMVPNTEFFHRLDTKIEMLNHVGLLSVIAPFWNSDSATLESTSEDQMNLLVRYLVARWGAYEVAWLVNGQGAAAQHLAIWNWIGQNALAGNSRAPVVLFVGKQFPESKELRDQSWFDAIGFDGGITIEALRELAGSSSITRPLIQIASPSENKIDPQTGRRINDADIRHELWRNLLAVRPAGTSYSSDAVANWNTTVNANTPGDLPLWFKSLFLPGAKQMDHVSRLFTSIPFWELRPAPELVAADANTNSEAGQPVVAQTADGNLGVCYLPENRTLELSLKALPRSPALTWLDPRTGETNRSVAVIGPRSVKFPAPGTHDWVLSIQENWKEPK
jgi:hypothetical protein